MLLTTLFVLFHLVLNILLSREVTLWIPARGERIRWYALLWLLPVAGAILAWRRVQPDWFGGSGEPGAGTSLSAGLLSVDAIFNPGAAYIPEAQRRSEITIRMEGEMYDRELPDHIHIDDPVD